MSTTAQTARAAIIRHGEACDGHLSAADQAVLGKHAATAFAARSWGFPDGSVLAFNPGRAAAALSPKEAARQAWRAYSCDAQ